MIKPCFILFLLVCTGLSYVNAQDLPSWSEADRARLKKGELIAGVGILVNNPTSSQPEVLPRVAPEPEIAPLEPAEQEPEYNPRELPEEYLVDYFVAKPDGFLIDPQRLLSMQESIDREGFLEYHADDSAVDIRMYLFDAQQEIPPPYTIQKLVSDRYAKGPLTAVVFCFMGDPSRNQLALGGEGVSAISQEEVRNMLESARIKAMEKSDPATQVESFVVQLSIRLYWLEKELAESIAKTKRSDEAAETLTAKENEVSVGDGASTKTASSEPGAYSKLQPFVLYFIACLIGVIAGLLGLVIGWRLWRSSRKYHFPVLEIPERLGANYAAGVGAVISFHDKLGSPSQQRDQVPDYLTRM